MTKSEWRHLLKDRLEAFVPSPDGVLAQGVWLERMVEFLRTQSGRWSTYNAHQFEPQMEVVVQRCPHLEWVYPRLRDLKKGSAMDWWIPGPRGFVTGPFGLREPDPVGARQIEVTELSGFIVPGLGFDHGGHRLGRGGGFYDQALASSPQAKHWGVGFDCQLVPKLPTEDHDQKLDGLITESGVHKF